MMQTRAFDKGSCFEFVVHLDTTQTIPDPTLPAPEEGQEDTRPLAADPAWVNTYQWCKQPPDGRSLADYLADCKREAELLAALDPRLQPAPTELAI